MWSLVVFYSIILIKHNMLCCKLSNKNNEILMTIYKRFSSAGGGGKWGGWALCFIFNIEWKIHSSKCVFIWSLK